MNKFALGAAILGLISVVTADMMSRLAQKGVLPTIVLIPSDQSPKRLADTAHTAVPESRAATVARSIGIDMSATATIPSSTPASLCDDSSQAVLVTRSIGVEGTTTTPIATPEPPCDQSHK
ncbi:MAG: hypothetical protein ACLP4V_03715 [Methylocella sp.]